MAKHLISLIDGTMISASRAKHYESYSNIFELACLLQLTDESEDGLPQVVFYTSGISSQPDTSSIFDLMTGNSIKSQIIDQYTNICANFDFKATATGRQADKIYLFGFSRGAMAVRALAGLIAEFGLLQPRDIRHLPVVLDAWDRSIGRGNLPGHIDLVDVEVEFVGLFDSVMGGIERLPLFNPIRFRQSDFPAECKNGVQILAIDENRLFFKPKPWSGTRATFPGGENGDPNRFFRQIWMPGLHADVGGCGNTVWGRAALLAMIHFIEKGTRLSLDQEWISSKKSKFRKSIRDKKFFIKQHRGPFSFNHRSPISSDKAEQRTHPICDPLEEVTYAGRQNFRWRDVVFKPRFSKVPVDPDLASYFEMMLR